MNETTTEITVDDMFEMVGHFDEGCEHCGCLHCQTEDGRRPHCCDCCCDHRE